MIRSLVVKELRHHGAVISLLFALTGGSLALATTVAWLQAAESGGFALLQLFLIVGVPLLAAILANRLVVVEYGARTQLFLEVLPVPRIVVVATKYVFGAATLGLLVGLAFAASCARAWVIEGLTVRFLGLVIARTLAWTGFVWSFAFFTAFMGRYRYFVLAGLAAVLAVGFDELDVAGPWVLVDDRFPTERVQVPLVSFATASGLGLGLAVAALALALVREGSVAARLAHAMSLREQLTLVGLAVAFASIVFVADSASPKKAYEAPDAWTVSWKGATVACLTGREPRVERRIEGLVDRLAALRGALGLGPVRVSVSSRATLAPRLYERARLSQRSGVLVRANLAHDEFHPGDFAAWVMRELLVEQSGGRVSTEDRRWVLLGYTRYVANRFSSEGTRELEALAAYGTRDGLDPDALRATASFERRFGADVTEAVSFTAVRALIDERYAESSGFLRATLAVEARGVFGAVADLRRPVGIQVAELARSSVEDLEASWARDLGRIDPEVRARAAALPVLDAAFTIGEGEVGDSGGAPPRRLELTLTARPEPPWGSRYEVRWGFAKPFAWDVAPADLSRSSFVWSGPVTMPLDVWLSPGQRLVAEVVWREPTSGFELTSGRQRLVVE